MLVNLYKTAVDHKSVPMPITLNGRTVIVEFQLFDQGNGIYLVEIEGEAVGFTGNGRWTMMYRRKVKEGLAASLAEGLQILYTHWLMYM